METKHELEELSLSQLEEALAEAHAQRVLLANAVLEEAEKIRALESARRVRLVKEGQFKFNVRISL